MKATFEDELVIAIAKYEVGSRKRAVYFKLQIAVTQFQSFPSSLMQLVLIPPCLSFCLSVCLWTEFEHGLGVTPFAHIHFDAVTKHYNCAVEIKMKAWVLSMIHPMSMER